MTSRLLLHACSFEVHSLTQNCHKSREARPGEKSARLQVNVDVLCARVPVKEFRGRPGDATVPFLA